MAGSNFIDAKEESQVGRSTTKKWLCLMCHKCKVLKNWSDVWGFTITVELEDKYAAIVEQIRCIYVMV